MAGVENPYQAPLAEAPPQGVVALRDLRHIGQASLWFYGYAILAKIVAQVRGMPVRLNLAKVDTNSIQGSDKLSWLWMIASLAAAILYLIWKHRAAANARILNAEAATISPALAVGSYFIPFVNLVVPYQAMAGIARASGIAQKWVAMWWAGQLGGVLLSIAGIFLMEATAPYHPTLFDYLIPPAKVVVSLVTFYVSCVLIMRITRAQRMTPR